MANGCERQQCEVGWAQEKVSNATILNVHVTPSTDIHQKYKNELKVFPRLRARQPQNQMATT